MALRLHLDHASLAVPDLDAALALLAREAGLEARRSPADPRRHSRIHLDRSYLEVALDPSVEAWQCPLFFLRFDDPAALRDHLTAAGIPHRVGTYQGVDGTWDDVEIGSGDVPLPILVRRTHSPQVAADWPPALEVPHPCGATTLEEVHVTVADLGVATDVYARLLGGPDTSRVDAAGRPAQVFATPPGRIVLSEGVPAGIAAVLLGIPGAVQPTDELRWLDLPAGSGVRIGFTRAREPR